MIGDSLVNFDQKIKKNSELPTTKATAKKIIGSIIINCLNFFMI